jgi:hypothetical protein
MKTLTRIICVTLLGASIALGAAPLYAQAPAAPAASDKKKNWTAPNHRMYGQQLVDEQMAKHKELLSATLHGTPPGTKDVYTMFAGSFPERIGNPDDPDDIDVIKKGITILDPRWKRVNDKDKKFVVLVPMRDAKGENVGLVVYAFKNPPKPSGMEEHYLKESNKLRDELAKKIPSYNGLFDAVK